MTQYEGLKIQDSRERIFLDHRSPCKSIQLNEHDSNQQIKVQFYLGSPAFTPTTSKHLPISTSSAPPSSDLQRVPVGSAIPWVANLRRASIREDNLLDQPMTPSKAFYGLTCTQNVTSSPAHVALLHIWLEIAPKIDWLRSVVILKHVPQIFDYQVGIIVCFDEPISLGLVVGIHVQEGLLCFGPKVITTLRHFEGDGRK